MSVSMFMYEGDGLVHTRRRPPATLTARPATPKAPAAPAAAPAATPAVSTAERRAEALRQFFPKIGAWLADRVYFARMREVEHYLSEAADAADLESRIRRLERGMLARY